jgi:hypothetical protein
VVGVGLRHELVVEEMFERLALDVAEELIDVRGSFRDSSPQTDLVVYLEANCPPDLPQLIVHRFLLVIFNVL